MGLETKNRLSGDGWASEREEISSDPLDKQVSRRAIVIAGLTGLTGFLGGGIGGWLLRGSGPGASETTTPTLEAGITNYTLSQEQLDAMSKCVQTGDTSGLNQLLIDVKNGQNQVQSQLETVINKPEATIAPTASESEADKAKDILYSFFNDTLGLTPGLDKDGKMIFTDRDGRLYHVDDIKNDECVEGFIVPRITVSFKGNEVCEATPEVTKTKTNSPTASPSATNSNEKVMTNTPKPPTSTPTLENTLEKSNTPSNTPSLTPSRTNTLPATATSTPSRTSTQEPSSTWVPTNTHYPIPTATVGPAPTLEPTATDIP